MSSIHKGATGTCTAVLHVIGLEMHHDRPVESVQTLDTGTWGSAVADQRYYNAYIANQGYSAMVTDMLASPPSDRSAFSNRVTTSEKAPGPIRPYRHTPRDDLDQGPLDVMTGMYGHASTQSQMGVLQVAMRNAEFAQGDLEALHTPQEWKLRMHAHGSGSPLADAHAIKKVQG